MMLSDGELRVLGVLMEKSLTQAGAYPMTVNAITAGANQLQNRDPVLDLGESEVSAALQSLQRKGLTAQAPPSPSARSVRYEHRVVERLQWDRREQAILAELILRGRQTAGELRTHASRMTSLSDLPAVSGVLEGLEAHDPPYVEELPREPGRSANRFRHLLSGQASVAAVAAADAPPTLEVRVERLEAEMGELRNVVHKLSRSSSTPIDDAPAPGVQSASDAAV